jgi:hypothetical protein
MRRERRAKKRNKLTYLAKKIVKIEDNLFREVRRVNMIRKSI